MSSIDIERVTENGLAALRVHTARARGLVYLQGAHVAAWQPSGHDPVIWMSPKAVYAQGKALRGGIPICFPWFGANAEHPSYPAHGFARTREFEYRGARERNEHVELELALVSDERTRQHFPFEFEALLRVAFGPTLELEFAVTNTGREAFEFEEALHSYFVVGDVQRASVSGLQGSTYSDKVREMAVFTESEAQLRFAGETDRVYESAATCTIVDPGRERERSLVIAKRQSATTVVWNPWTERAAQMSDLGADAWPGFLCVESANVGKARLRLAPGESHTLGVQVSVTTTASG
jgi:glucose-6-phosphate 1-epimerase